jgi:hypothetical protein
MRCWFCIDWDLATLARSCPFVFDDSTASLMDFFFIFLFCSCGRTSPCINHVVYHLE